jgi:hypothetical protein
MTDSHPPSDAIAAIRAEAERIEEDATYSSKRHYEAHDIWNRRHLLIGLPAVVFSVLATANLLQQVWPIITGLMGVTVAVLTALLTFLKPSERAASHKSAGDQYLALRNDVRVFRTIDLLLGKSADELSRTVTTLAKRRNELNSASQQTPRPAFERARKGIEDGEARYTTDKD